MIRVQHYTGDKFYRRKDLDIFKALTNGIEGSMLETFRTRDSRDHIFVMRENGTVIGWVSASRIWSDEEQKDGFYTSFFIAKKHRKRGLAKRFVVKLRQWIPDGNYVLGFHYKSVRRLMKRNYVEVVSRDNGYYGWDKYRLIKKMVKHETKT